MSTKFARQKKEVARRPSVPSVILGITLGLIVATATGRAEQQAARTASCDELYDVVRDSQERLREAERAGKKEAHALAAAQRIFTETLLGFSEECPQDESLPAVKYLLGRTYYMLDDFDRAVSMFEEVVARYPDHEAARFAAMLTLDVMISRDERAENLVASKAFEFIRTHPENSNCAFLKRFLSPPGLVDRRIAAFADWLSEAERNNDPAIRNSFDERVHAITSNCETNACAADWQFLYRAALSKGSRESVLSVRKRMALFGIKPDNSKPDQQLPVDDTFLPSDPESYPCVSIHHRLDIGSRADGLLENIAANVIDHILQNPSENGCLDDFARQTRKDKVIFVQIDVNDTDSDLFSYTYPPTRLDVQHPRFAVTVIDGGYDSVRRYLRSRRAKSGEFHVLAIRIWARRDGEFVAQVDANTLIGPTRNSTGTALCGWENLRLDSTGNVVDEPASP